MAQQKTIPKISQKTASRSASREKSLLSANPALFHIPIWAAFGVFVLATLVFFRAQIFGDAYFWEDFTEYVYPAQSFAATYLRGGELPFWNPFTFSGMPFLADVAVGFFYPPNMLLALFVQNGKLPVLALECLIIAHFVLAQCTMFLFMRSLKASDAGSLIASLSYGFSGIMVHHVFHPMMVAHFAWFPLAFLHFRNALRAETTPSRFLHSLVSGAVLGVMMLSGHPQTTLYLVLFLFFYTLWFVGNTFKSLLQTPLQMVLTGVAAALPIAVGAGLFAIQLLHSQEFSAYSERNAMTFERASMGSMQAAQALTAFVPTIHGAVTPPNGTDKSVAEFSLEGAQYYDYWETAFYAGIPAIVLALFAAVATFRSRERERLSLFLVCIAVFGFLFALGSNGFLFGLFFKLPLFDRFRIPARMIAFVTLAVSILAGIGFDELFKKENARLNVFVGCGTALLLTFIAAAGAKSGAASAVLMALAAAGSIIAASRGLLNVQISCALVALLTIIDLNVWGSGFNANRANPLEPYTQAEARLSAFRADFAKPDSLFRVSLRERGVMLAPRNFGLLSPVMMYEGYMPLLVERRLPPAPQPETTNDLLNIRYSIGIDTAAQQAFLRERTSAYPRARMVYGEVQAGSDDAATIAALAKSGTVSFENQAILEKPLSTRLSGSSAQDVAHSVHCTNYGANSMTYAVETAQTGLLVLSETWYPAWKATLDGQDVEILRTNYSLRGVFVPSGKHTITLRYDSDAFRAGARISLATLVLTTLGILALWIVQKKNTQRKNTLPNTSESKQ